MGKYDDKKYEAIGLLSQGNTIGDVARQLEIPASAVSPWKIEADLVASRQDVETVMAVEPEVIDEIVHEMTGDWESEEEVLHYMAEAIDEKEVDEIVSSVVSKVDGLQVLSDDMQKCATLLVQRMNTLLPSVREAKDLQVLADSLAKLQTAFFAKGANVNVLNMQAGVSENGLSAFSSMQREA